MAFKFVTIFALFALVNAGGLVHPVTYTQIHNVAVAHPSADEAHHIHHQSQYSQGAEAGSHIHYVPAYAKTVHIAAPVHSGPVYSAAPAYTHVTYGAESYGRSLGFNEGPSSTPSSHTSEEATTTAEPTTTESTTAEAENTEETSHAARSTEPEPTQASYHQHVPATSPGYKYDAPSESTSDQHTHSGLPTFFKYQTSLQHHAGDHHVAVPSVVKYEVPAQTVVKYAAPTHYSAPHQTLVHYAAPVQTVYHKTVAPQPVHHVKYASPEHAVYTSFGEHPPAVYSHHSAPVATVHHTYAAPQPTFIKYAAAETPGQVTYVAPAPAVYTKYGVTESSSHASHVAPAPTAYIKYDSPAPITHHTTTYGAPQHSVEASSTKLIKYNGPAFHSQYESSTESQSSASSSSSSSGEENKDSVEVNSPESDTASHQASRAYLPPATNLVSHTTYQVPAEQQYVQHQESARSQSNEHNIWSTDGASSHVSFKGFGTSYGY